MTFDLTADLRTVFNWNVKILFLFLTAEYESTTNAINQVVIWDKIITRKVRREGPPPPPPPPTTTHHHHHHHLSHRLHTTHHHHHARRTR